MLIVSVLVCLYYTASFTSSAHSDIDVQQENGGALNDKVRETYWSSKAQIIILVYLLNVYKIHHPREIMRLHVTSLIWYIYMIQYSLFPRPLVPRFQYSACNIENVGWPGDEATYNKNYYINMQAANPASSVAGNEATNLREKRGLVDNQQPQIRVSSSVLACKGNCVDKFITSIYPLKHYSYLVSPFIIFRRIWDAYDNLGKCQHTCLGKL